MTSSRPPWSQPNVMTQARRHLIDDDDEDMDFSGRCMPKKALTGSLRQIGSARQAARMIDEEKALELSPEDTELDISSTSSPSVPRPTRLGGRTESTSGRLQRQGFRKMKSNPSFAVRSIRRGSADWRSIIKPFVADIAFRSLVCRRYQSDVSFRPYTCFAAVLFVDLSSYSKITAAIAHRGAHTLSHIVNAYLSRILKVIRKYGGDVVKFAGDAVLVVWDGEESDLGLNVLAAAKCVLELQDSCGIHPVEGTSLAFKIHCGLSCGPLESEVFVAPTHATMQRLYHSVGGSSLVEISELVELAKAGEVCVSSDCVQYLKSWAGFDDTDDHNGAKLLHTLDLKDSQLQELYSHIGKTLDERLLLRNIEVEEDFIHPSVIQLLSHGGLSPTHIAQIRSLCVLFIAMTSNGSSVNWLMEVQGILDRHRCPIVQIIDDDKGVHVVAAINLYESVPESSLLGLQVCRELVDKQVGCAIGVATGSTFCGVTGSSSVACRWDVTGPPPVRAARLMQHALRESLEVVIDESVYKDPMAATQIDVLGEITIKGSLHPVTIYTLSKVQLFAAFRVLETVHASIHDDAVEQIKDHIYAAGRRCAVVVTGIPLGGKKVVCQRAAGESDLVPFLHVCDDSKGLLQLARTIATWFQYSFVDDVRDLANSVIEHMDKKRWSRAHDECSHLVNRALHEDLRACFVLDRVQFLDDFSLSLIRDCLQGRPSRLSRGSSLVPEARSSSSCGELSGGSSEDEEYSGKICFMCVHVSMYHWKSAPHLVEDITRSHRHFRIPIVRILGVSRDALRCMFRGVADMEVADRWLDAYAEASGYAAGYFMERAGAIRVLSGTLWSEGKQGFAETSEELVLHIPPGCVRKNILLPVTQINADVTMRFMQIYDELPPLFQILVKLLAIATRKGLYKLPRHLTWEVLNDLIAEGVESDLFAIVLDELKDMCLLRIEYEDDEEVLSLQCPALADIAVDVSTPSQILSICEALIDRLGDKISQSFRIALLLAELHHEKGESEVKKKDLWARGYRAFLVTSKGWPEYDRNWWKELMDDAIRAQGIDSREVLGEDFYVRIPNKRSVGSQLPLLKIYAAPIAFGPMGHTFTVICRNTFHENGVFYGASEMTATALQDSTKSAAARYLKEMDVVENFLIQNGLAGPADLLEGERQAIKFLSEPAKSDSEVKSKADVVLDQFIPQFIQPRLDRLYALIVKLRSEPDAVVMEAGAAIRKAYEALQNQSVPRNVAAEDAFMTMAVLNWKPKKLPEYLPLKNYTTVARLRNKTLKRLTESEMIIYRHQQTIDDLEAFLVITALLHRAQEMGIC